MKRKIYGIGVCTLIFSALAGCGGGGSRLVQQPLSGHYTGKWLVDGSALKELPVSFTFEINGGISGSVSYGSALVPQLTIDSAQSYWDNRGVNIIVYHHEVNRVEFRGTLAQDGNLLFGTLYQTRGDAPTPYVVEATKNP